MKLKYKSRSFIRFSLINRDPPYSSKKYLCSGFRQRKTEKFHGKNSYVYTTKKGNIATESKDRRFCSIKAY